MTRSSLLPQAGTLIGSLVPESWHKTKGQWRLFPGIYRGPWNFGKQERLSLGPLDLHDSSTLQPLIAPRYPHTLAPCWEPSGSSSTKWAIGSKGTLFPGHRTPRGQQDCGFNLRMHAQGCQRSLVRCTKTHLEGSCEGFLSSSSELEGNCVGTARALGRLCCLWRV